MAAGKPDFEKRPSNRVLQICLMALALAMLGAGSARAYDVSVSAAASTNGSFVGGVWTPTANSNLSYADLNTQLAAGNAGVTTNGAGTLTIQPAFVYTSASDRHLTLTAAGDASIGGIGAGAGKLSVTVNSTGTVTVTAAGVTTGGGSFTSSGTGFTLMVGGVHTSAASGVGGAVALNHTGAVVIQDGGVTTGGGSFTSHGTTCAINTAGVNTTGGSGGDITLNHVGDVTITQGGLATGGGKITIDSGHAVDVAASTNFQSGGGNIYVQAATAITVNAAVVSQPGTGGVLTVIGPVTLNVPPVLGAGNITFIIGGTEVPALATWGLLVLATLIGLAAAWRLRAV